MKKTISILTLFFLPLVICGQDILSPNELAPTTEILLNGIEEKNSPKNETNYLFMEVVNTNLSKDKMWINLKKWISSTFNDYKYVVDLEDKETGTLVIKWEANLPIISNLDIMKKGYLKMSLKSTINIDIKENKYRYTFLYGSVSNSIMNIPSRDLELMGNLSLNRLKKELRFISDVSKNHFKEDLTWYMDVNFIKIISEYNSKGLNDEANTLSVIRKNYISEINSIKSSLLMGMTVDDDF